MVPCTSTTPTAAAASSRHFNSARFGGEPMATDAAGAVWRDWCNVELNEYIYIYTHIFIYMNIQ